MYLFFCLVQFIHDSTISQFSTKRAYQWGVWVYVPVLSVNQSLWAKKGSGIAGLHYCMGGAYSQPGSSWARVALENLPGFRDWAGVSRNQYQSAGGKLGLNRSGMNFQHYVMGGKFAELASFRAHHPIICKGPGSHQRCYSNPVRENLVLWHIMY